MTVAPAERKLTTELVVQAARKIVAEHGVAGLSLRRLAADLGVTAPALYGHVGNKENLLRLVAAEEYRELATRMRTVDEPDPVRRIKANAFVYFQYALESPGRFGVLFAFRPWAPTDLADAEGDPTLHPDAAEMFEVAVASVREAVEEGLIDRTDPFEAALCVWAAVHGAVTVALLGLGLGEGVELRLFEDVVDTVLVGMGADRSRLQGVAVGVQPEARA